MFRVEEDRGSTVRLLAKFIDFNDAMDFARAKSRRSPFVLSMTGGKADRHFLQGQECEVEPNFGG